MRVISGKASGQKLVAPKDYDTRPTADRVKESIFNIIQNSVYDSIVIDLFAGTGNLGIEALSRKAKKAYFIDQSAKSIKIINENLQKTKLVDQAEIIHLDVASSIKKLSQRNIIADIIFMDPPYLKGFISSVLEMIIKNNLLAKDGIIVVEHDKTEICSEELNNLFRYKKSDYGNTSVSFYRQREEI